MIELREVGCFWLILVLGLFINIMVYVPVNSPWYLGGIRAYGVNKGPDGWEGLLSGGHVPTNQRRRKRIIYKLYNRVVPRKSTATHGMDVLWSKTFGA